MESHDYSSRSDKSITGWRKKITPPAPIPLATSAAQAFTGYLWKLPAHTYMGSQDNTNSQHFCWGSGCKDYYKRLSRQLFKDKKDLRQFHFCRAIVDNWLVLRFFFFQVHHLAAHKAIRLKIKKLRKLATVSSICLTAILSRMNTITV